MVFMRYIKLGYDTHEYYGTWSLFTHFRENRRTMYVDYARHFAAT